jgi:EAL domain-containing protein (putative c-di-GMP-specific phosphodiesterase class I)
MQTHSLEKIRELGCVEMQGFLFSPPCPMSKLLPLLEPCRRRLARSA